MVIQVKFLKIGFKITQKLKKKKEYERIQVGFLKLGQRTLKDQKSSLKKFKSNFLAIVPFIYKKNVYGDDKLEDD